jgi:hypothetical protein
VKSASSDCQIAVQSGDSQGHTWSLQSSAANASSQLGSSFQIIDRTAESSRLLIDTSGNVGLGTSAPVDSIGYPSGRNGLHTFGGGGNGLNIIEGATSARLHLRADDNTANVS